MQIRPSVWSKSSLRKQCWLTVVRCLHFGWDLSSCCPSRCIKVRALPVCERMKLLNKSVRRCLFRTIFHWFPSCILAVVCACAKQQIRVSVFQYFLLFSGSRRWQNAQRHNTSPGMSIHSHTSTISLRWRPFCQTMKCRSFTFPVIMLICPAHSKRHCTWKIKEKWEIFFPAAITASAQPQY